MSGRASPNDYAIVIGVGQYPNFEGDVRTLGMAELGARKFYEWLIRIGIPESRIAVLATGSLRTGDSPVAAVNVDDIENRTADLLNRAEGDPNVRRLYFYYAGHGVSIDSGTHALLASDSMPKMVKRCLDREGWRQCLERRKIFREQVFFFDACRQVTDKFVGREPDWCELTASAGVKQVVYMASGHGQFAGTAQSGMGCFTQALLEGLEYAIGSSGSVTCGSLATYLGKRVPQLTKLGESQTCEPSIGSYHDLVLVNPETTSFTVTLKSAGSKIFVRRAGSSELVAEANMAENEADVTLPRGIYIVMSNDGKVSYLDLTDPQPVKELAVV